MLATLASVGLPGLSGFPGEFLVLLGSFKSPDLSWAAGFAALAATGVILGALYMLWMYQRVFFGPCTDERNLALKDLSWRELGLMLPLLVFIFWMGVQPAPWLSRMEPDIEELLRTHRQEVAEAAEPPISPLVRAEAPVFADPTRAVEVLR
jgi:NADH-quinone oxidoreductase subunit M